MVVVDMCMCVNLYVYNVHVQSGGTKYTSNDHHGHI